VEWIGTEPTITYGKLSLLKLGAMLNLCLILKADPYTRYFLLINISMTWFMAFGAAHSRSCLGATKSCQALLGFHVRQDGRPDPMMVGLTLNDYY
jgi:hypothetical protein